MNDKLKLVVLVVLLGLIGALVSVDLARSDTSSHSATKVDYTGLNCVICTSTKPLQPAKHMQTTGKVQQTMSAKEMLRSEQKGLRVR